MNDTLRRTPEDAEPKPRTTPEADTSARTAAADESANVLANHPRVLKPRELKHIDKCFKAARKQIENIYDRIPKAIKGTESPKFKQDILEKVLAFALYDIREWWEADLDATISKGGTETEIAKAVTDLREKYFINDDKEGKSLMGQAVLMADLYLKQMARQDGAITGNTLIEMLDSASKKAAFYVDLLRKDKYEDVVRAIRYVLGDTTPGSASAATSEAMTILEKRFNEQFPNGEIMKPLWMAIAFLPEEKRLEFANRFKKSNPGKILAFLEDGNRRGAYSPDEMQKVLGKPLNKDKQELYANLWSKQHDFNKQVELMAKTTWGSRNPVNEKMTLFGTLGLVAKGAAWGTIAGNAVVTGWVHMKDKGVLGAIGAIPSAIKATVGVTSVKVAGAGLAISRYWQRSKENPERNLPGEREEIRGLMALRQVKSGSGLWNDWNSFLKSGSGTDSFDGGKAFSAFVDYVLKEHKTFGDEDEGDLPERKLSAQNFLNFLKAQKSNINAEPKLDYARLIGKFEDKLGKSSPQDVKNLAKAFYVLKVGGATGRASYDHALEQLPKLT